MLADIAKEHTITTIGYNGTVPGPLIRFKESVPVTVELFNDTDTPELVHWHGQIIRAALDGAAEEKSLEVPAHGQLRYQLTPQPEGVRFVHTHVMAMSDLNRGTYTGQFGIVYIEPGNNPGWEIGYRRFTINGKCLGYGEPVRVKDRQRVLFHFLNASATENIQLALPGHQFQVVALDGNPVPQPQSVEVLELGTAERISATVEMKNPGVWVLGTPMDHDRKNGMGIVVEYANKAGSPRWVKPQKKAWDYTLFGQNGTAQNLDETIPLVFGKINGGDGGSNRWTINGTADISLI